MLESHFVTFRKYHNMNLLEPINLEHLSYLIPIAMQLLA